VGPTCPLRNISAFLSFFMAMIFPDSFSLTIPNLNRTQEQGDTSSCIALHQPEQVIAGNFGQSSQGECFLMPSFT